MLIFLFLEIKIKKFGNIFRQGAENKTQLNKKEGLIRMKAVMIVGHGSRSLKSQEEFKKIIEQLLQSPEMCAILFVI